MNEIMTREEFLKERNAVYEPDAVAGGDDVCKGQDTDTAVMTEENVKLSADGITVSEVVVKGRRNRQYAGLILFITAVAGAVVGAVFYGKATVTVPDEMLEGFLEGRIHGGFFGNAAASFISALIWCIVPFLAGLCAVGQPVGALIPAFKGIGVGMTFAALVNIYGANGIPAFAVFVLPSAFIGTVICCYQCRLSVLCSNSVLAVLKGRRDEAPHYYKIYLERFAVCCIGCFLLGIADAVITFLFRPLYETLEIFVSRVYNVNSKNCLWHERRITLWKKWKYYWKPPHVTSTLRRRHSKHCSARVTSLQRRRIFLSPVSSLARKELL